MTEPYPASSFHDDVAPGDVLGRRVLAHCIDFAILMAIVMPIILTTSKIHQSVAGDFCKTTGGGPSRCVQSGSTAIEFGAGGTNALTLIVMGYWMLVGAVEGRLGAFAGKRVLGLTVIGAEGGRAGLRRGLLRGLLMFIDSTFCFVIGLVTVTLTSPRRRIGDFAARTLVVRANEHLANAQHDPITWDELRGVYVYAHPVDGSRQQWDDASQSWVPLN